jgi:hypothetical protein
MHRTFPFVAAVDDYRIDAVDLVHDLELPEDDDDNDDDDDGGPWDGKYMTGTVLIERGGNMRFP